MTARHLHTTAPAPAPVVRGPSPGLKPLRTIRDVVKARKDPGLGWLYHELSAHLRRVGPSDLTTAEIAAFVGGMSADTTSAKLATLVKEGLLERHRKGRGAYVYSLPAPVMVEFAPRKSPFKTEIPRPVPEKTGVEPGKTPPLMNEMNESMSDDVDTSPEGFAGESEQRRLIRTTDFNTPHTLGKALLELADQCDPAEVKRLVGLDEVHSAANPYAYLTTCLANWLQRQQDERSPRPAKSAPGKYAAFVNGSAPNPSVAAQDRDTTPATVSDLENVTLPRAPVSEPTTPAQVAPAPVAPPPQPEPEAPPPPTDDALREQHNLAPPPDDLAQAWTLAHTQLALQFDRATFDMHIADARLIGVDTDGTPVLHHDSAYSRDHLRHRLYRNVRRALSDALGTETEYTVVETVEVVE